jgi:hypothetical protein
MIWHFSRESLGMSCLKEEAAGAVGEEHEWEMSQFSERILFVE